MPTYPINRRRPILEDLPEDQGYEEDFEIPQTRAPPKRRKVQRQYEEQDYTGMDVEREEQRPKRKSLDRLTLVAVLLVFFMLICTIGMAVYSNGIASDLSDTKWELQNETKDREEIENELDNVTTELDEKIMLINQLTENLTERTNKLNLTRQSLNSTKAILNDTMAEVDKLMTNKTELMAQVTFWKNLHPYNVDNPTYATFKSFYQNDTTDEHAYINDTYICEHFARDFKANATFRGIRCAFVIIELNSTYGHCINAVSTTDHGTIYIEPQSDLELSTPVVGQLFQGKLIKGIVVIW